jgi:cytochrome c-type biogenesis protein CcmE
VLALAVGLTLWGLRSSISYFYTPAQAAEAHPPPGRAIQLGGLVEKGSVVRHPDGLVEFTVGDLKAVDKVVYRGDLPDLFREGQGVVTTGAFRADGVFEAKQVLAKHDERYMPKEVSKALKKQGEWRGDGSVAAYQRPGGA